METLFSLRARMWPFAPLARKRDIARPFANFGFQLPRPSYSLNFLDVKFAKKRRLVLLPIAPSCSLFGRSPGFVSIPMRA